jgi:putative transcriptional regulator
MADTVRIKMTPEATEEAIREVDWARIDAMTDEDIARQVAENPDAAPIMTPAQIRAARVRHARRRSGLTQEAFAERYRIPLGTLRDWEQGRREPDAAALAYLRVIEREPEAVERALAAPLPAA